MQRKLYTVEQMRREFKLGAIYSTKEKLKTVFFGILFFIMILSPLF